MKASYPILRFLKSLAKRHSLVVAEADEFKEHHHGFNDFKRGRSQPDVIEAALAHVNGDEVRRAYNRARENVLN